MMQLAVTTGQFDATAGALERLLQILRSYKAPKQLIDTVQLLGDAIQWARLLVQQQPSSLAAWLTDTHQGLAGLKRVLCQLPRRPAGLAGLDLATPVVSTVLLCAPGVPEHLKRLAVMQLLLALRALVVQENEADAIAVAAPEAESAADGLEEKSEDRGVGSTGLQLEGGGNSGGTGGDEPSPWVDFSQQHDSEDDGRQPYGSDFPGGLQPAGSLSPQLSSDSASAGVQHAAAGDVHSIKRQMEHDVKVVMQHLQRSVAQLQTPLHAWQPTGIVSTISDLRLAGSSWSAAFYQACRASHGARPADIDGIAGELISSVRDYVIMSVSFEDDSLPEYVLASFAVAIHVMRPYWHYLRILQLFLQVTS